MIARSLHLLSERICFTFHSRHHLYFHDFDRRWLVLEPYHCKKCRMYRYPDAVQARGRDELSREREIARMERKLHARPWR